MSYKDVPALHSRAGGTEYWMAILKEVRRSLPII